MEWNIKKRGQIDAEKAALEEKLESLDKLSDLVLHGKEPGENKWILPLLILLLIAIAVFGIASSFGWRFPEMRTQGWYASAIVVDGELRPDVAWQPANVAESPSPIICVGGTIAFGVPLSTESLVLARLGPGPLPTIIPIEDGVNMALVNLPCVPGETIYYILK